MLLTLTIMVCCLLPPNPCIPRVVPSIHPLIHSPTHSPIHSLIHSPIYSFTHSLTTHSSTHPLARPPTHSSTHPLTHSPPAHSSIHTAPESSQLTLDTDVLKHFIHHHPPCVRHPCGCPYGHGLASLRSRCEIRMGKKSNYNLLRLPLHQTRTVMRW